MSVEEKLKTALRALEQIRLAEEFVFDDEMQCDVPVAMSAEEMQEIAENVIMQIDNDDIAILWRD